MITNFIYVVISIIAQEGYRHLLYDDYMQSSLINIFVHYKLLLTAIYYLRRPYTTLDGYILLTATIYYFRLLYITFHGSILLLTLTDCYCVRIQNFLANSRTYGLKARLEFNISLLALIQFCFFWSLMVSSMNFNIPFWKCYFIKNTQMRKMWNFLHLALQMVCKGNK